eukprot:202480_1
MTAINAVDVRNQGESRVRSVADQDEGKNKTNRMFVISVSILLAYSVIVSTIALIIATSSSSLSSPCDCTVNSLAAKTELTNNNGVGDSGFCEIIDFCIYKDESDESNYTSTSPSKFPSTSPSEFPSTSPNEFPLTSPSEFPSTSPSEFASTPPSKFPST